MLALGNHALIGAALGLSPAAPVETNRDAFATLISDTPVGETLRARLQETAATQRIEFQAHDVELGYTYEQGAVIPDGAPAPPRDPMGTEYTPSSRPGSRLPHAWLEHSGQRISTHDLVGSTGEFALITGVEVEEWERAANAVASVLEVEIRVARVGDGGPYADPDGTWARLAGISDRGAILVRPDNFVAWRCPKAVPDCSGALADTLTTILGPGARAGAAAP